MFTIVVPRQQKDKKSRKNSGSRYEIADVEADLLLNVDNQQVRNAATSIDEPVVPVEE